MEMEVSPNNYHFKGWATRSNILCSDGRTIMPDAFKHQDGTVVPLVWNHDDSSINNVLGKALLHSMNGDMYAYCLFNDTESGAAAREVVQHGDIVALSIRANRLKHTAAREVIHGEIKEVSLVLAGANRGARIESVMSHGDNADEEFVMYHYNPEEENLVLNHSEIEEETEEDDEIYETAEEVEQTEQTEDSESDEPEVAHADSKEENTEKAAETEAKKDDDQKDETVADIINTMNEKQKLAMCAVIAQVLENEKNPEEGNTETIKHSEGGENIMKTNVFDQESVKNDSVLTHADQEAIIALAKSSGVGSFKAAMEIYAAEHQDTLAHGIDDIEELFPNYKDTNPGAPELLERDQSWVGLVMRKTKKSPFSRIRTRQADARAAELKAKGYNNREEEKALSANIKLISRTTDPQTVYYRDELHRDDIIDITDFDVVAQQKRIMRNNLEETIALAALVGDGREDTDPDKIHETHIRPVWKDAPLYTIRATVDIKKAREELQGSNTSANFGENYIYAEAIITAALYAREKYKGKGQLDFYCTPHLLNVMLLARDLNGRRIYDSAADLAKALNVGEIVTVEQFEGLTRTDDTTDESFKLLGLFVNMGNYQFGSTKGGEITNFEDFDIDFNKYKYLMETRLSGALTEVYSAIALEEPVAATEEEGGATGTEDEVSG